jgi:hypothetical protein
MFIRVIKIGDYAANGCEFIRYQPIVSLPVTKHELQGLNIYIYDLVPLNESFNLYIIDDSTFTLNLFRKNSNDLHILSDLDDNRFNETVVYFVLGRFLSANVDEVTRLYQGREEVCGLQLNGQIGAQTFAQAESLVPTNNAVGGRKIRMHRKGNKSVRVKRRTRKPRRSKHSLKLKNQYKK